MERNKQSVSFVQLKVTVQQGSIRQKEQDVGLGLLVDPVKCTALVGHHLLWLEPQVDLLLGAIHRVAAVANVPAMSRESVHSTISAMQ